MKMLALCVRKKTERHGRKQDEGKTGWKQIGDHGRLEAGMGRALGKEFAEDQDDL